MLIHVISLDRTPERWAEFQDVNQGVADFRRFRAIDGQSVDAKALVAERIFEPDLIGEYPAGAIGCAMSHIALWDACLTAGQPLTICEDDGVFNHRFAEHAERILGAARDGWHIVLWGFSTVLEYEMFPGVAGCAVMIDAGRMHANTERFARLDLAPQVYRLARAFGTLCYSISPAGVARLKSACLPLKEVEVPIYGFAQPVLNRGIDVAMCAAYPGLNALVAVPTLVSTKQDVQRSTIVRESTG